MNTIAGSPTRWPRAQLCELLRKFDFILQPNFFGTPWITNVKARDEEMLTCVLPGTLFPEAKTICGGWMMTPVCWGRPPCRGVRTCADGTGESHNGTVSPISHSRPTLCSGMLTLRVQAQRFLQYLTFPKKMAD